MPRPGASPEALTLARNCLRVVDQGGRYGVLFVPPGYDADTHGHLMAMLVPPHDVERVLGRAAARLATLVDMGMAHERNRRVGGFSVPMPPLPGLTPPTPAECLTSDAWVGDDDDEGVEAWVQARQDRLTPDGGE